MSRMFPRKVGDNGVRRRHLIETHDLEAFLWQSSIWNPPLKLATFSSSFRH